MKTLHLELQWQLMKFDPERELIRLDYRVAIIAQIQLQQNRTDLALKEVQAARKWAQDSLLVNIAESWVGLRMVSADMQYPL